MAKVTASISIDEDILEQAKAVGERDRRNFSNVVEIALLQFIERHMRQLQFPGLTPEPTPKVEKA
jgi:hypothetical protein